MSQELKRLRRVVSNQTKVVDAARKLKEKLKLERGEKEEKQKAQPTPEETPPQSE